MSLSSVFRHEGLYAEVWPEFMAHDWLAHLDCIKRVNIQCKRMPRQLTPLETAIRTSVFYVVGPLEDLRVLQTTGIANADLRKRLGDTEPYFLVFSVRIRIK